MFSTDLLSTGWEKFAKYQYLMAGVNQLDDHLALDAELHQASHTA
jgi:hypothetical protein